MNKSDGERVHTIIKGMGYEWTDNEENADLLGILACSVRQKSIDKVYSRISKWNKWKNNKNLITFISGCVLQADKEKFLRLFDLVFETIDLKEMPEMISQYGVVTPIKMGISNGEHKVLDFWEIKPFYNSTFEAYIPVQNGCDKFCTFCAVPYTRGREISRPSEDILNEVRGLVSKGYKSITLLGQNVNSYGLDMKGEEITFPELLKEIGEFGELSGDDFRIYFTSPHPRDMTDELIKTVSKYKCLATHMHIPLQSGDNGVLKRMNRNHTVEEYIEIINSVRKNIPEATIFTDIIVGFAGETKKEFENTRKVMEHLKFNMAYIAKYSPRPGAASYKWEDSVSGEVKKARLNILTEELKKHSLEYNKSLINKKIKILVTGSDRKYGYLSGITEGRIIVRFKSDYKSLIGHFAHVIIKSATGFAIEGELIKKTKIEQVKL
jgi:tRNA-2-methylthio-N6-dimethylallyladenosine synthase